MFVIFGVAASMEMAISLIDVLTHFQYGLPIISWDFGSFPRNVSDSLTQFACRNDIGIDGDLARTLRRLMHIGRWREIKSRIGVTLKIRGKGFSLCLMGRTAFSAPTEE